jgi:very-short-patch-repair endonuclease
MGYRTLRPPYRPLLEAAARQHGVVAHDQLLGYGLHRQAVKELRFKGVLHPVHRGVYAVGRPQLDRLGLWKAACLSCGRDAVLSHDSAAALLGIRPTGEQLIQLSVPPSIVRRRPGIVVHRRILPAKEVCERKGIPVTTPVRTLVDLAARLDRARLEAAVNAADTLDLVDPESLREALPGFAGRPGVAALRTMLDRRTFRLTDSRLERYFLPLVCRAGLPLPETRLHLNGFKVDFYFRALGIVVETDGLRYHRTPAQQARALVRDQTHLAAGLVPLRFSHEQVRFEPNHVVNNLRDVARRTALTPPPPAWSPSGSSPRPARHR